MLLRATHLRHTCGARPPINHSSSSRVSLLTALTMWTFITTLVLLTAGVAAVQYDSENKGYLFKMCPSNEALSLAESSDYTQDDRRWKVDCKLFQRSSDCSWSDPFKLFEEEINYNCPVNHVITGIFSAYRSGDRRWNFRCCSVHNLITFECRETPMVNYGAEGFGWSVPGDNFLTGVRTHGNINQRDHRWAFSYCRATIQDASVNSQILAANEPTSGSLTDGDVQQSSKGGVCVNCNWPKSGQVVNVPYTISDDFAGRTDVIQNAFKLFHACTCVRFVPRQNETNYVSIEKKNECSSFIGQIGGNQTLSLGFNENRTCLTNGIVQHELMHVIGFSHEHTRMDRDVYVKINYENIQEGKEINFARKDSYKPNVPYDYTSIQHYGLKEFSKNGKATLTLKLPSLEEPGQRREMSEGDILKINEHYGCTEYLHHEDQWDNQLGGNLAFTCPGGQAVSGLKSVYDQTRLDRRWSISCKFFQENRTCSTSAFVNNGNENFAFRCPDHQVMAGVSRDVSSGQKRWSFTCCSASNFEMFNCKQTPVMNYWEENFNWKVASSNFLRGVSSSFNSTAQDRRWRFSYCQGRTQ